MNEVRSQTAPDAPAASKIAIADGDIHPAKQGQRNAALVAPLLTYRVPKWCSLTQIACLPMSSVIRRA